MRARNALFSFALCLFLCGPAIAGLASWGGVSLPSWLTAENASYLSGGMTDADLGRHFSVQGFVSGRLQETAENAVGNYVPMKASALLGSAAIQREAIAISNILFNWSCYPTHLGSDYVYAPADDALSALPSCNVDYSGLRRFCEQLAVYAERYPDINFKIFLVDISTTSAANPAMGYISCPVTTGDLLSGMQQLCEGVPNVEVLSDLSSTTADYHERFFRSDHHWNARGALEAFDLLSDDEAASFLSAVGFSVVDGPSYSGAYSRSGLCLVNDQPLDFSYSFAECLLSNGRESEGGSQHIIYESSSEQEKHWQFYDLFYRSFEKINGEGQGSAVLVSDSFGYALLRPLSLSYETVLATSALHSTRNTDESLDEFLGDGSISEVMFVGHAGNFNSFLSRNPSFLQSELL